MKDLSNLSPAIGSNRPIKRIGRGIGSGTGKTAGKGHKGQKARKGGGIAPGFEGGQNPLYRRVPKFGFSNRRTMKKFQVLSSDRLSGFNDGDVVSRESLFKAGLIANLRLPIKILMGEKSLEKKIVLKVDKVSKSVKSELEKIGGSIEEN